jgi:electron transport complex protein RnfB
MSTPIENARRRRRDFLKMISKGAGFFAFGALFGKLLARRRAQGYGAAVERALFGSAEAHPGYVWQIDPEKCQQCGNCATHCVLTPSASKCVHEFKMCGYCRLCLGFFTDNPPTLDEGAENQMCPTGAIQRVFVEEPYYQYKIDRDLCIGCARCVKGCNDFGNGSLYMQIDRELCVNCNQCSIAPVCEGNAIHLIPASRQYIKKKV